MSVEINNFLDKWMDNKKEDMLCLGINFIIYEKVTKNWTSNMLFVHCIDLINYIFLYLFLFLFM